MSDGVLLTIGHDQSLYLLIFLHQHIFPVVYTTFIDPNFIGKVAQKAILLLHRYDFRTRYQVLTCAIFSTVTVTLWHVTMLHLWHYWLKDPRCGLLRFLTWQLWCWSCDIAPRNTILLYDDQSSVSSINSNFERTFFKYQGHIYGKLLLENGWAPKIGSTQIGKWNFQSHEITGKNSTCSKQLKLKWK